MGYLQSDVLFIVRIVSFKSGAELLTHAKFSFLRNRATLNDFFKQCSDTPIRANMICRIWKLADWSAIRLKRGDKNTVTRASVSTIFVNTYDSSGQTKIPIKNSSLFLKNIDFVLHESAVMSAQHANMCKNCF